jgi:hypothetical protein
MKKLLFIPLLMISSMIFAQTFQVGIKGGINVSNFVGSSFDNVDKKAIVGFQGGALLSLLLGDHVALQPEAVFSSQGARVSTINGNENWRVSYLNVPVNLKYRFNGGFYLEAGPQVGFKLSENVPNGAGGSAEDFAKNLDFSIDAGLGFQGKSGLGIGARYAVGISKVGNLDETQFNPNFRNGVAQLFIFYTLFNNRNNP